MNRAYLLFRAGVVAAGMWGCLLVPGAIHAQGEASGLPDPLTLEYALSLADEPHPELLAAGAQVRVAEAEQLAAKSLSGFNVNLEGRLQWVEPSPLAEQFGNEDHQLGLVITKVLYDFGLSKASKAAAENNLETSRLYYLSARRQRRVEIMRLYFEVLLADLRFFRDNEAMAVAYVQFDRQRDRRELGQKSDLDVLERESIYQKARRQRMQSEMQQRLTRTRLAHALNRPGQEPATLIVPELAQLKRELPQVEELEELALSGNAQVQALRAEVAAARERVAAARASDNPVLKGNLEAYDYSRQFGRDDTFRAGVSIDVPLVSGGRNDAAIAREQAEVFRLQAELSRAEMQTRLAVLELWQQLDALRIQREEARAATDFSDLNLDHSRTLYEMEARATLGESMVHVTDAQLRAAEADYQTALAWAQLDALTGMMLPESQQGAHGQGDAGKP